MTRGVVLPYKITGTLSDLRRGAPWGSRRQRTCAVGLAKPGAEAEPHRRQFLQTQGPAARKKSRKATQILRAGRAPPIQRDHPRKRGPGKAVLWARSARRPRPRWRFAYFFATEKVGRRPQAAKLSARWRAGSSRPTKKRSIIVPSSAPFGGTFPQWGGLEERQNTQRVRWLGKPRRGSGTAPAIIFANPGPSGPAGI